VGTHAGLFSESVGLFSEYIELFYIHRALFRIHRVLSRIRINSYIHTHIYIYIGYAHSVGTHAGLFSESVGLFSEYVELFFHT